MSALSKMGVLAVGLSCLTIGNAWAEIEAKRDPAGQTTQSYDTNRQRTAQQGTAAEQGQRHTAQFRGAAGASDQSGQVQHFLASCLLKKNQGEVEIGEIAQQRAQNPQVKQFAQQMVQDHRQLVQKLQPLAGMQGPALDAAARDATSQPDVQRQATDSTRLPGSSAADRSLTGERAAGQKNTALNEVAQIESQIAERCLQAFRDELEQKQGADFDKCYVGSQIAGHMQMLAALEVLQQQGPDQLKQIAQAARPTIEQHLDQAKQLMKQLEGASATSSQAERPSRTQR